MIRDFLDFLRHVLGLLHFVRGVLVGLLFVLVLCALVLMVAEDDLTLGEAIYLTAITGLTVGYGDIVPKTILGRIAVIVISFVGVIFVGIVVAVATRALSEAFEEKSPRQKPPPDG